MPGRCRATASRQRRAIVRSVVTGWQSTRISRAGTAKRGQNEAVPRIDRGVMRTTWNGSLTFGLVSIPVGLAPATKPAARQSDVSFRLLHRECLTPIKQKRWCPKHDREVGPDEIVKGWEASKGQYVVVEDERARGARGTRRLTVDRDLPIRPGGAGGPDLSRSHLLPRPGSDARAAPSVSAPTRGDARDGHRRHRPFRALRA